MRSPNGHNGGGHNNHRRNNNNNNNRGPRPHNGNNNGGHNRRPHPQNLRNQIFDSHGPGGERVRGNAFQVHEKYLSLAREAEERIDQENYYQHAEHYYRIVEAIQEMEAEQRARFTVVENADPFAGGQDGYGEQPDVASGSEDGEQPQVAQQQQQPRAQRQPYNNSQRQPRGPITQSDVMSEPLTSESDSGPMFSLAEQPATTEAPADTTSGDDDGAPRTRSRGPRRSAVTA